MRKAGGEATPKTYLQYTFKLVFVSNYQWSGRGDKTPSETITFQFGSMDIQYQAQTGGSTSGTLSPYWKSSTASVGSCLWCPR